MKFQFGHEISDETKVSKALLERGIRALRAAPGEINAVGLYKVGQDGYESYSGCLPAYMRATETGEDRFMTGIGHKVMVKFENMLPVSCPNIYMSVESKSTPKKFTEGEFMELSTRKDRKNFSVCFNKDMLKIPSKAKGLFPEEYAPTQFARLADVPGMVTIHRIFSSFLRTHKFPAFAKTEPTEVVDLEKKRQLRQVLMSESIEDNGTYKKHKDILGLAKQADTVGEEAKKYPKRLLFYRAKPTTSSNIAWGPSAEMPTTYGVNVPFESALSKPDKETVPRVIERFFMLAYHDDPETCLKLHSECVQQWKTSLFTTPWGHRMSHLARCIELAIPAQARVYPIVQDNEYFGSYISGGNFVIAVGRNLVKPVDHTLNFAERSCFNEPSMTIGSLLKVLRDNLNSDEAEEKLVAEAAKVSLRSLALTISENYSPLGPIMDQLQPILNRMNFKTPFRSSNAKNIQWFVDGITFGHMPGIDEPTTPDACFSSDPFISFLSAFGRHCPSPNMPGAPKMIVTEKLPEKFMATLGVRLVDVDLAAQEWKEFGKSGEIQNGMTNLSAKYEHAVVSGKENKDVFNSSLWKFRSWYKSASEESKGTLVDVVEEGEGNLLDTVIGNFDFDDF